MEIFIKRATRCRKGYEHAVEHRVTLGPRRFRWLMMQASIESSKCVWAIRHCGQGSVSEVCVFGLVCLWRFRVVGESCSTATEVSVTFWRLSFGLCRKQERCCEWRSHSGCELIQDLRCQVVWVWWRDLGQYLDVCGTSSLQCEGWWWLKMRRASPFKGTTRLREHSTTRATGRGYD